MRKEQSESVDLRVESADGRPVFGGLRATISTALRISLSPSFIAASRVHALVAMHLPERYLDPGVWDATAWLREQGISVVGSLKVADDVTP